MCWFKVYPTLAVASFPSLKLKTLKNTNSFKRKGVADDGGSTVGSGLRLKAESSLAERLLSIAEEEGLRRFKESMLAFLADPGGLLAGFIIFSQLPLVLKEPWVIMLYPLMLTLRGNVGGIFSGRLSTGLHLGLIEPKFRGNTEYFKILVSAMQLLSFTLGLAAGLVVSIIQMALEGLNVLKPAILTALATLSLSIMITMPITCLLGFMGFRRNIDPDVLVYPVMSTTADIAISLIYVLVLKLLFIHPLGELVLALISTTYAALVLTLTRIYGGAEFWSTVREASVALTSSVGIAMLSGLALSRVKDKLAAHPGIVMVYPALIDTVGDLGSAVGSIFTTRLAEGSVERRVAPGLLELYESTQIWASALLYHVLYGFMASGDFHVGMEFATVMLCFLASSPVIFTVSRFLALGTFVKGLNPDNFVIPLETTVSDSMVTILLALFLAIL